MSELPREHVVQMLEPIHEDPSLLSTETLADLGTILVLDPARKSTLPEAEHERTSKAAR